MNILIADDSTEIRKRIIDMLSEWTDITVVGQAENVSEAIERIHELKPDIIILDISMPGGSGIDVLEKIERNDKIPVVIILTNYPFPQYQKRCLDAGADFFFDKSNEFERVIEVLGAISEGRHTA
jgi:DNA-binding NarL/FixJ family response regulator